MSVLDELIHLSRRLGDPALDAAILGEGNTSIACGDGSFLVKASGSNLGSIDASGFVRLQQAPILALLDGPDLQADQLQAAYKAATLDAPGGKRPSVETVFHACCLAQPGVTAIAHTHPTAINALTCSASFPQCFADRLFPDEAVVLGPETAVIPYIDPGLALARCIRDALEEHRQRVGVVAKCLVMQNHGVIALGRTAEEAFQITQMAIKAARIRLGALQAGGIRGLGGAITTHLLNRDDEKYRQAILAGRPGT